MPAEGDRQAGELLADVVVQVARDPRPLGVLGLDQPAGQVLDLAIARLERGPALTNPIFGLPALGDVDDAADVARVAAVGCELRDTRVEHPSVRAVSPAQTVLHDERRTRLDRRIVDAKGRAQVFRMGNVHPAVVPHLLDRQPHELH